MQDLGMRLEGWIPVYLCVWVVAWQTKGFSKWGSRKWVKAWLLLDPALWGELGWDLFFLRPPSPSSPWSVLHLRL